MLVRPTNASRASDGVSAELIREILDSSQRNNPGRGVTGRLCCNANTFLQTLEGPRSEVSALYKRPADDSRHKDLTILDYAEISMRCYSNWSMGWAGAKRVNRELLLKYSARDHFDPFDMDAEQITGLLLEMSASCVNRKRCCSACSPDEKTPKKDPPKRVFLPAWFTPVRRSTRR